MQGSVSGGVKMKTRNGFVSNSSSSSFVLIAKNFISIEELTEEHIGTTTFVAQECLDDGDNVFQLLNKKMLTLVKKNASLFNGAYLEARELEGKIIESDVNKEVYNFTRSHHSAENEKELKEWIDLAKDI